MSTYSGPQPPQKYEHAATEGGKSDGGSGEALNPEFFDGTKQTGKNAKLSAVTAGHSSKIPGGPAPGKGGNTKHSGKVEE
jgi:hypothetical protein